MNYEGKVYRPWPEEHSLLIQVTLGCSHNKCTFCNMFREKRFRIKDIEEIFRNIEQARKVYPQVDSIFLIDGNVLALKTPFLLKIFEKLTATFPECTKISLYTGLNDLRRKSVEELSELKEAGLTMGYSGLESGDPLVLEKIKKSMTPKQAIEGMKKAKAAGIQMLLSFIFGLGGKERSDQHIIETTRLLNIMEPEEIAPMALAIQPGTELAKEVKEGKFILPTPLQVLQEEKYLLENMNGFKTYYWGDHGNNIVPMKGRLPEMTNSFHKNVCHAIEHHPIIKHAIHQTYAW